MHKKILEKMDMDYLKYKMRKKDMIIEEFSHKIGMSKSSIYSRIKGESQWKYEEMKNIKQVLDLTQEEFNKIFGF